MTITTCIVLAAASLLPALIASVGGCFRERNLLSCALFLLCGIIEATYVSAFFHTDYMMSLLEMPGQSVSSYLSYISMASLLGCLLVNVMLFIAVRCMKQQDAWKWIMGFIALFLFAILMIGLCVSMLTGVSLDQGFFAACCGVMGAGGIAWGLTYKEICVIGNIYVQSGLCLLSALWLTWATTRFFRQRRTVSSGLLMSAGIAYGFVYILGFGIICRHYAMPMGKAFDLCYHELIVLAFEWHTTYNNVNYLIFIILFLVLTLGNILTATILTHVSYRKQGS